MMADMERRKRVMQRSIKLGHCICDPKQPCPCPLFKDKHICTCAGERLESPTGAVQLTQLVEKPGCASKIDQAFLKSVLKGLPAIEDPRVLVGVPAGDDAGLYDMGDGQALVQTVDVFTPSVDDPYTFGQVAAANSVSDIYAMGGTPLTALSVIGFPARKIPDEAMFQILAGGIDKMKEAGCAIIGGHSINDAEIKAGFAVTGLIDKNKVVTNAGARPGDVLILTKPLGTGIIAFAAQIGRAEPAHVQAAARSMTTLNKEASRLMVEFGAHACTDVTGFSLMGHLTALAAASGVDAEVIWDDIPLLPGVLECAAAGILPGALERNKESCGSWVEPDTSLPQEMTDICYDAQTSGGLLIAIEQARSAAFLKALKGAGVENATLIGRVPSQGSGRIRLTTTNSRKVPSAPTVQRPETVGAGLKPARAAVPTTHHPDSEESVGTAHPTAGATNVNLQSALPNPQSPDVPCCADAVASTPSASAGSEMEQVKAQFKAFLGAASAPHHLDAYTKQAMAIALSVALRCEPCLKMHLKNARQKGFTPEEIDEAAWMGISFAGSPAMVFYEQLKDS
jgi:selenide,water dikinase